MWLKQIPVRLLMPFAMLVIGCLWVYLSYWYNSSDWSIIPALVGFPLVLPLAWWIGSRVDELRQVLAHQQTLESSMRANASRLYSVIDALDSGILLTDSAGVIVNANKPLCLMFQLGLPPHVVGSHLSRIHSDVSATFIDQDQFLKRTDELVKAKLPAYRETLATKDGRALERDFIPIAFGHDYFGFLWQYHDVTERRRGVIALEESHSRLELKRAELAKANGLMQTSYNAAQYLAEVATAIAGGDLDRTAAGDIPEDLTSLATALNQMAGELRTRIMDQEASRVRIIAAQEEVRRQVAEQLHGSVQSKLLVLGYHLGKAIQLVQSDPVRVKVELEGIHQKLEALREEEVRGLSHRLHPAIVRMGLRPALLFLRDQFEGSFAINMALDDRLTDLGPSPDLARDLTIYRAVEELMTNALKHAQCTMLSVVVRLDDEGTIHLEVADNGKGFDPDAVSPGGLGLVNTWDQVQALGGAIETTGQPGGGTKVTMRMPYRPLPYD